MEKLYLEMDYEENLGWCKPVEYINDNKKVVVVQHEGMVTSGIFFVNGAKVTPESCKPLSNSFCNISLEEAESIIAGWLGVDVDELEPTDLGCGQCPWRDDCEAMDLEPED